MDAESARSWVTVCLTGPTQMRLYGYRAHNAMVKSSIIDACWARSAGAGRFTAGQTKISNTASSKPTAAATWNLEITTPDYTPGKPRRCAINTADSHDFKRFIRSSGTSEGPVRRRFLPTTQAPAGALTGHPGRHPEESWHARHRSEPSMEAV